MFDFASIDQYLEQNFQNSLEELKEVVRSAQRRRPRSGDG